jgi:hypothetical protein
MNRFVGFLFTATMIVALVNEVAAQGPSDEQLMEKLE